MRLLLHVCCAPCAAYPWLELLLPEGHQVKGLWFNPNIQPYREFERRLQALEGLARGRRLDVEFVRSYPLAEFLRGVLATLKEGQARCNFCYRVRLDEAARRAAGQGFKAFTTSLLVSPYQNHELVRRAGEEAAGRAGVAFLYRDWRPAWPQAVALSRELGLYRQPYCGCVFSEAERYRAPGLAEPVIPAGGGPAATGDGAGPTTSRPDAAPAAPRPAAGAPAGEAARDDGPVEGPLFPRPWNGPP